MRPPRFIVSAVAEKMASMLTVDYLRREASLSQRKDFEHYLNAVADVADEADKF